MKTITVQGLPFELHDDGVVAVPPGTAMSAGAILPLSVLREFVRRVEPKRRPNGKIKSTSYEIEEWRGRRWLVRADFPARRRHATLLTATSVVRASDYMVGDVIEIHETIEVRKKAERA